MATLDSSNIVNGNVIEPNDILQLYNALSYPGASPKYLVEISGSLEGTASYATTASFALNGGGGGGGVTSIIAGENITITSTGPLGTGDVTISSSGGGGGPIFPFSGSAVITGSLDINGLNAGADLTITGSVVASEGFTGSLLGIATLTTLATTATSSLTSSKVTITNNTSTNIDLPLIFANSSTAGTQQLSFDNDANGPYINPLNNSIEALSFTGSLLGTASQAANSTLAATASTALSASTVSNTLSTDAHFLTFVDSNNAAATSEKLFTNSGLSFKPAIGNGTLTATVLSASNISASSIKASAGFTGSLLGTATQAANSTLAATATSALSASTISNTTSSATHFLTFVDSNNAAATSEKFFTNSGLSFKPAIGGGTLTATVLSASNISASSIISSAGFTGSLLGTSSNALTSSFIRTISSTAATAQYLTFVDSNNTTNAPEQLSTNANLYYYPSTNILTIQGTVSASSFTGSLRGTASFAVSSSRALVANITEATTKWYQRTSGNYPIPEGRDVGLVFNYTGRTGTDKFRLNTSSAQLGDQVRIATTGTWTNNGLLVVSTSGSAAVSGTIIVPNITGNPSTNSSVYWSGTGGGTGGNNFSGSQSSWKFICVKASPAPIWHLVNYIDRDVAANSYWYLAVANNL